jgi:hypothetical protein
MISADSHFAKMSQDELRAFLADSFARHSGDTDFLLAESAHAQRMKDRIVTSFSQDPTCRTLSKEIWAAAALIAQTAPESGISGRIDPKLGGNPVFLDSFREFRQSRVALDGPALLTA